MAKKKSSSNTIVENRKARFNYHIEETLEAGIMLLGSEVKSLRRGGASIAEAHAAEKSGELYLFNANIQEYTEAHQFNHEPKRPRKLLLKKREVSKLIGAVQRQGITIVPLSLYFNQKGIVKLSLGIAKGKKKEDKREAEKQRDWQRDKARLMRDKG